jgi:hypothetical protein
MTANEAWILFKKYAMKKGYIIKVVGDYSFMNNLKEGKIIKLKSCKDGKIEVYEEGIGCYIINQ